MDGATVRGGGNTPDGQVLSDLDTGIVTAVPQEDAIATWEPAFKLSFLSL